MIVLYGAMLIVSMIAACVGPFYYCKKSNKLRYDRSESLENKSPLVHIKVFHPHEEQSSSDIVPDVSESSQCSTDSNEIKETKQVVTEAESQIESQIVPANPLLQRRRYHKAQSSRIWSSALSNQLDIIRNSSSEICGTRRVVKAQIESQPINSASKSQNLLSTTRSESYDSRYNSSNSLVDDKVRKLSSAIVKKWKSLKKTLIRPRSNRLKVSNHLKTVNAQTLSVPIATLNLPNSPFQYSAILQRNRGIDVSTSTRLSASDTDVRTCKQEMKIREDKDDKKNEASKQNDLQNDHKSLINSDMETLQELMSLIKHHSVNGKLICDLSISGLAMNQTQLINLFEATSGSAKSASIVTSEEASIISTKFRKNSNELSSTKDSSYYEHPLQKFYINMPKIFKDLSISRLFLSREESERSNYDTPSMQAFDRSRTLSLSRNETSHLACPKITRKFVA
ncbi:unnamed protein product [Xylocopa violacea]|uniref:Uncharacterized protein n=1 Tax=Xylocopa violacea TaxID=135666 RepID=A0ABP1N2N7_XYLVO